MSLLKSIFGVDRSRGAPDEAPARPVEPRVGEDERIYAIGDIHGRADLLVELLAQIRDDIRAHADGRRSSLVLLGDYVDRGDASAEALGHVARLAQAGAICLRGNHEAALVDFVQDPVAGLSWLEFGGLQTLASYGVAIPDRQNPRALRLAADALAEAMGPHLFFLAGELPIVHRSGNVVFAHAGLDPAFPLEEQPTEKVLWGSRRFLRSGWRPDAVVVHGHYASEAVSRGPGRICIDTGAYYSNCLTALRLDAGAAILQTGRSVRVL